MMMLLPRTLRKETRRPREGGFFDAETPQGLYAYLYALLGAWAVLSMISIVGTVGLVYGGQSLGGSVGSRVGLVIGVSLTAFSVSGVLQVAPKTFATYFAVRNRQTVSPESKLRPRDAAIYLQLAVAAMAAVAVLIFN